MESAQYLVPNSESRTKPKAIETLEEEYQKLCKKEKQIVFLLERCISEGDSLQGAIENSMDVHAASKPPSRSDQEREALKRLEEALMGESCGDDYESST